MTPEELNYACEWLAHNLGYYNYTAVCFGESLWERITKDFREAMTDKTNTLFEKCLANVDPDTREEVRRNMELTNLTWKDVRKIWEAGMALADYNTYHNIPIEDEAFYNNILKQFQDGCKQV